MTEPLASRPKNTRTYGSRRTDDAEVSSNSPFVRDDASGITPERIKHPSSTVVASVRLGSPSDWAESGGWDWKRKLADIDAGKQDALIEGVSEPMDEIPNPKFSTPSVATTPIRRATKSTADASLPSLSQARDNIRTSLFFSDASPEREPRNVERPDSVSPSPSRTDVLLQPSSPTSSVNGSAYVKSLELVKLFTTQTRQKARHNKGLSKKQVQETAKESARLKAQRHVTMGKGYQPTERTITQFLETFTKRTSSQSSDPIYSFSSSPRRGLDADISFASSATVLSQESTYLPDDTATITIASSSQADKSLKSLSYAPPTTNATIAVEADDTESSEEEDLLHPDVVLKKESEKLQQKQNLENARRVKMVALRRAKALQSSHPTSEDELEFDLPRASTSTAANVAVDSTRPRGTDAPILERKTRIRPRPVAGDKRNSVLHNLLILDREQADRIRETKEKDWRERGGTVKDAQEVKGPRLEDVVKTGIQQLKSVSERMGMMDAADSDDEEYNPRHGAASASGDSDSDAQDRLDDSLLPEEPNESPPTSQSETASAIITSSRPAVSQASEAGSPEPNPVDIVHTSRRKRKSAVRRVISDDEDDEAMPNQDSDGGNARPMIEDSDGENARPIIEDSDGENIPPPVTQQISGGGLNDARGPLKPLSTFTSSSITLPQTSGILNGAEWVRKPAQSSRSQPLVELERDTSHSRLSEPDDFGFGGMSQLFSPTQRIATQQKLFSAVDLASQPLGLLPAIQIPESRRRLNDRILMEQEQDLDPGRKTSSPLQNLHQTPVKELYLSENGFLTQSLSPSWNQPAFQEDTSERDRLQPSPKASIIRHDSDDLPSPTASKPNRRIIRGRVSPSVLRSPSISPISPGNVSQADHTYRSPMKSMKSTGTTNAFQLLMSSKPKLSKPAVERAEVDTFLEGEAVESDDEAPFGFGFGGSKGDDDDDEGSDGDGEPVKNLVDDQEMDEETQAKARVLEKVQEHNAEDEAQALKIAQDAVDGQYRNGRNKRRRGVQGLDDDSDSEDDDAVRRPKIEKKRRIDGDTLDELAKNPETAAFYLAYVAGLDSEPEGTDPGDNTEEEGTSAEEGRAETATREEIHKEIRQRKYHAVFDPNDVEWMRDSDKDKDEFNDVLMTDMRPPSVPAAAAGDDADPEESWRRRQAAKTPATQLPSRWTGGQQSESQSGGFSGRNVAVTGHDRKKVAAPTESVRRKPTVKTMSSLTSLNKNKSRSFE